MARKKYKEKEKDKQQQQKHKTTEHKYGGDFGRPDVCSRES